MMRFLAGCLVVAATGVFLAPSSAELRKRYGDPNSEHRNWDGTPESERFTVRAGVSLTVWHGSDHLACKCLVAPTKPSDPSDPVRSYSAIPSATVTEIPKNCSGVYSGQGNLEGRSGDELHERNGVV
jgi:hypothetical protein